jgi:hypothetical protein
MGAFPTLLPIDLHDEDRQYWADLATSNGAHAFLVKSLISGDDLDRVISKALAAIGPHKERPFYT